MPNVCAKTFGTEKACAGRGRKGVSIREIARMTGLSITTVSHAINGTRPVSEKSRRLVEEAIRRTGYRPNLAARALKTQKSNIIALIIPSTEPGNSTNCFFFDVLGGVKDTLQRRGYDLIVSTYSERRSDIRLDSVSVLKKSWIDGLLLVPNSRHSRYDELLAGVDLPTVLLDRRLDGCDLPLVCCDNESAAEQAVGLLADSGRARIGYLGGALDLSTAYDRYALVGGRENDGSRERNPFENPKRLAVGQMNIQEDQFRHRIGTKPFDTFSNTIQHGYDLYVGSLITQECLQIADGRFLVFND